MNYRRDYRKHLNAAQNATVDRIRHEHAGGATHGGSEGWTVLLMPTVGPAFYCELRHYMTGGRMACWVVEKDGSVSATNREAEVSWLVST